jgi:hypothetical protein
LALEERILLVAGCPAIVDGLLPLVRQFACGEYGIALGGAHAKGVADAKSDLDLYLFARQVLPAEKRARLCQQWGIALQSVTSWGAPGAFVQGGTDFYLDGLKVECWLRNVDYVDEIVDECKRGIVRREFVTWTVMGFYRHCTLSDLSNMRPVEDPGGILARWKAAVSAYPPKLRATILETHLQAAQFWPDNFHYRTAVERCDVIYTTGIVQQVVHNLIQVLFALNRAYFPGDKRLALAVKHLDVKPQEASRRIVELLSPGDGLARTTLDRQRGELGALVEEVVALVAQEKER